MRKAVGAGLGAFALSISALVLAAGASLRPAHGESLRAACCDELDERIAELTHTTALGGTSKLSFRLYRQINRTLLLWNAGFSAGDPVVDNHTSASGFRSVGQSTIKPGLTASYRLEIEAPSPDETFNDANGHTPIPMAPNQMRVRQNYWRLAAKECGGFSVGYKSAATDDITVINLGSQMHDAAVHYNNAFRIRPDLAKAATIGDLTWGQITHNVDCLRGNFVRNHAPILHGFLFSAAVNSDIWHAALRYQREANAFRFASGIGDMPDCEHGFTDLRRSASLVHDPTGLYVSVAGGLRNARHGLAATVNRGYFTDAQLGVRKPWLSFGKPTIFADRGVYNNINDSEPLGINPNTNLALVWGTLFSTEVNRREFGVEQRFDAATTLICAQAHFYDPKIVGYACDFLPPTVCGGDPAKCDETTSGSLPRLPRCCAHAILKGCSSRTREPNANTGDA